MGTSRYVCLPLYFCLILIVMFHAVAAMELLSDATEFFMEITKNFPEARDPYLRCVFIRGLVRTGRGGDESMTLRWKRFVGIDDWSPRFYCDYSTELNGYITRLVLVHFRALVKSGRAWPKKGKGKGKGVRNEKRRHRKNLIFKLMMVVSGTLFRQICSYL